MIVIGIILSQLYGLFLAWVFGSWKYFISAAIGFALGWFVVAPWLFQ